jgi:hypothetical protein
MVSKIFVCPDGSIPPQIATGNTMAPCVTKVDCIFDLLELANSRCNHVPPGAAKKQRKIQIRVAFKNRHDIDKALKRFELKHRGSLYVVDCQRCATTVETRRGMFLHWARFDDPYGVLNDRPPSP